MRPRDFGTVKADLNIGRLIAALKPRAPSMPRVTVRRPDDLLIFDLLLDNLELKIVDGRPNLVKQIANSRAHLVVEFPPQSFGEQAFFFVSATDKEGVPEAPSAKLRMSGPSRISFLMPSAVESLAYDLGAVLNAMRTWPLQLDTTALPDPQRTRLGLSDVAQWLAQIVESKAFVETVGNLSAALEESGAVGAAEAITAAGRRIAERTAGVLTGGAVELRATIAMAALQGEVDQLHRQFPSLREGDAHQAGLAALSLAGIQSLISSIGPATAAGPNVVDQIGDLVADWPFLPLLLAPHVPAVTTTALELPYRLQLSPIENARWSHADLPVAHASRTELWQTRLRTTSGDLGPDSGGKVRAIWSPDYELDPATITDVTDETAPKPFRMSLNASDRKMLVRLMAGWDETRSKGRRYIPRSSRARRLQLSALGALIDIDGNWDPLPSGTNPLTGKGKELGVDLTAWRHLAGLGRDSYVRAVYVGYLLPFRHDAALIKVTERKFESLGPGQSERVAVLRQREFIVVRRAVIDYDPSEHVYDGRTFPFTRVELLTRATPNLEPVGANKSALLVDPPATTFYTPGIETRMAFWPVTSGPSGQIDVTFDAVATDITGQPVSFSMPMLFVSTITNAAKSVEMRAAYNRSDPVTVARRTVNLGGTTVAYAPSSPSDKGDLLLPTASMTFAAGELTGGVREDEANFYPEVESAVVGVKAVQKLLGQPNAVMKVKYPPVYRDHGFGEADPSQNKGQVFLQALGEVRQLAFGGGAGQAKSDALGALAAPQMSILGLSRVMGPVAGKPPADLSQPDLIEAALGDVIGDKFDPTTFFDGATILGGVRLSAILKVVTSGLGGSDVPKLLSRELPDRVEARFDWSTVIDHPDPLNLVIPDADPAHTSELTMRGLVTTPLGNPGDATYEATATLTNFKVNLFGFIILWFDDLTFAARKGQKPDVAVNLHPQDAVMFGGPLEFVNTLRDIIPSNGFSDPPSLTITPSGIAASYSMNLPALTVGIFSLTNASLGAGFNLPFDATPASVKFNFAERQHPFCITVSLLGGGGFFAIGISSAGVQEIEAAIEFGAEVAINLGVASGSVEIKAGVYFHWLEKIPDKGSVELSGYVRLHGELSVLGLISVSLTFNLQLSFLKEGGSCTVWGEATLTVEVDVLFVSFDVSVSCRKEFAGADADPKFIELIPDEPTWAEYCDAFAEEAA